MITFIDGPAAGQTMNLRRTPPMLRVVRSRTTGKFDGLDQLADEPTDDEEIFVYRIAGEPMRAFVDYTEGGRRRGGLMTIAKYQIVTPQPTDEEVRSTQNWRDWATRAAKPSKP